MSSKTSNAMSRPTKPLAVVEVGTEWVKLLHAVPSGTGVAAARLYLERAATEGGDLAETLAQAVKRLKLGGVPVIGCLPRQMVTIRILELPSTDPGEIADMVDLQADKQTPYTKDEIHCDYRILGSGREGYTRVMLAIVQRAVLRQRYAMLEEAGMDIARLTVSTEGTLNWARSAAGELDGTVLLEVDSYYSEFAVMGADGLVATRSILIGANHLISGGDKAARDLLDEVARSLETCRGENPGIAPTKLVVTGASVAGPELAKLIGAELGLKARVINSVNSLVSIPNTPSLKEGDGQAVSLTPLVGIALAPQSLELNLVPDAVRVRKDLVINARRMTKLGVMIMTALTAASLFGTLKYFLCTHYRDEMIRQVEATSGEAREVARMQEIANVVRARQDPRFDVVHLLQELHPQVPAEIYFESVEFDLVKGEVRLTGSSPSRAEIGTLAQNLEQSPLLQRVEAGDATKGADQRFKFRMVCALEKQ